MTSRCMQSNPAVLLTTLCLGLAVSADAQEVEYAAPGQAIGEWVDPDRSVAVEVRRLPTSHMLVPVVVHDQEAWFILDSGASGTVVDVDLARGGELPSLGNIQSQGAGGNQTVVMRGCDSLEVGPFEFEAMTVVESDLTFVDEALGTDIGGILGREFFLSGLVEVDPRRAKVRVHHRDEYAHPEDTKWTPLDFSSQLPAVRARFEGDREGLFRIDIGANGGVVFHAPAVKRYGLLEGRETTRHEVEEVGGLVTTHLGPLQWFELGGRRFENLRAGFIEHSAGALGDRSVTGNLGNEILGEFVLLFDYRGTRVAFLPNPPDPRPAGDEERDDGRRR